MDTQATKPMLTVQRVGEDLLRVGLTGEWIAKPGLPGFDSVEKVFTSGPQPVKAIVSAAGPAVWWPSLSSP